MAEIVKMPKLSDTMEEGVIAKWAKKEGDSVREGDLLAEIETDKATMEYEAPVSGTILKLIAPAGKKFSLGEPICAIGKPGEDISSLLANTPAASVENQKKPASTPAETTQSAAIAIVPNIKQPQVSAAANARIIASPLAKKIAADRGIDLRSVSGSGPGGRVVVKDLEGVSRSGGSASNAGKKLVEHRVPVSMMRQTIARRLHAAKNDAPHFYLRRSVKMDAALDWRAKLNAQNATDPKSIKVSVNDIVMMATARALLEHPGCNASWNEDEIIEHGHVHMAMAVALPTGLITPVIPNCDQLDIRTIATQAKALTQKAKDGKLAPNEYTSGTFTVSNLGMMGIDDFTAIINPPQAAILAVGATKAEPVVNAFNQIVIEQRMRLTMSCDHRVIDGAMGAQFLATLVSYLENPVLMFS